MKSKLVGQVLFPNDSNRIKKNFSVINENPLNKPSKKAEYQLKLCILLNNNDSNYREKRNNLSNLEIKYDEDYRMRLTKTHQLNANYSVSQEKIPSLMRLNKNDKSAMKTYLNEETCIPKKVVYESFDIKKSVPEFKTPQEINREEHKEKWYEKYPNSPDQLLVCHQKKNEKDKDINVEKEIYEKIKRKEEELNSKRLNRIFSCDIDKNIPQFVGLRKLIETTNLIRRTRARKSKITHIELFHYDKKQWSERLMDQLRLKEISDEIKKKKVKKEIERLSEFGLEKEGITLETKLRSIFEKNTSNLSIENDNKLNKQTRYIDNHEILGKITQSSQDLLRIAKKCRDYPFMKKNDPIYRDSSSNLPTFKNNKKKRTNSMTNIML